MKKSIVLLLALAMCFALFSACGGDKPSEATSAPNAAPAETEAGGASGGETASELPEYNFNLGTMFYDPVASTVLNTDGMATQKFADLVYERSNGRVTITVQWASVLGGTGDMFDMVRSGDLDMQFGGALTSMDARFGIFNVPGLIDDYDMAHALVANPDGGLYQMLYDIYQDNNIEMLSSSDGQFRGIFNNTREVRVPGDCEGFMLRAYADECMTTYWNGLCNTTIMAIAEVYTGLQLGTIDGLEFCPTAMVANGYTDVLDYYSDIDWQWQANTNITMNKQLYDSLDPETQQLLRECALEAAGTYYGQVLLENMAQAYEYMTKNGIQVYELTDADRALWKEYSDSVQETMRDIVGAETYDAAMAISQAYRDTR